MIAQNKTNVQGGGGGGGGGGGELANKTDNHSVLYNHCTRRFLAQVK